MAVSEGRIGRDGQPFEILKVRTMVAGAERLLSRVPHSDTVKLDYIHRRMVALTDVEILLRTNSYMVARRM